MITLEMKRVTKSVDTYTGVWLGHFPEEGDVNGADLGQSQVGVVEVQPQIVGPVRAQVRLASVQVVVPHGFNELTIQN